MSADPEAPADPTRITGGHIVRNVIYRHDGSDRLEIVTGWSEQGTREFDQELVRPAQPTMPRTHPCSALNLALVKCSFSCPPEMKLAGRTAVCNDDRQALMKCLVKNKSWQEPPANKSWYKFW